MKQLQPLQSNTLTKKDLIQWFQNNKSIPDTAILSLSFGKGLKDAGKKFSDMNRQFHLWFSWSNENSLDAFKKDFVDFSESDSSKVMQDVFAMSI